MKTIIKMLFAAVLISGTGFTTIAQQSSAQTVERSGKYEVNTQLVEKEGTYDQRKLYREFLVAYMKNCPYISHFDIHEAVGSSDNHDVVWSYEVNGWDDITKFYSWVREHLQSSEDNGLKKAMTPYKPDYAIGGQIKMEKVSKSTLAKD